jgi:hypothetical protein
MRRHQIETALTSTPAGSGADNDDSMAEECKQKLNLSGYGF